MSFLNKDDKNYQNSRHHKHHHHSHHKHRHHNPSNESVIQKPQHGTQKLVHTEGNMHCSNVKPDGAKCGCDYGNAPFIPPDGPPDGDDLWDLQFCRWWGWNWVRKQEEMHSQKCARKCALYPEASKKPSPTKPQPKPAEKGFLRKLCSSLSCIQSQEKPQHQPQIKKDLQKRYNTPCASVIFDNQCCSCKNYTLKGNLQIGNSVSTVYQRKDHQSRRKQYKINISKTESWVKEKHSSSSSSEEECPCRATAGKIQESSTEENIEYLASRIQNICEEKESCCSCRRSTETVSSEEKRICNCGPKGNTVKVIKVCCCCKKDKKSNKKKTENKEVQTEAKLENKQIQKSSCKCAKHKSKKEKKCCCKQQKKYYVICQKCKCTQSKEEKNKQSNSSKVKIASPLKQADEVCIVNKCETLLGKENFKSPFTGQLYRFNIPKVSFPKIKYNTIDLFPKPIDKNDSLIESLTEAASKGDEEHKSLLSAICDAILSSREKSVCNYDYETGICSKTIKTSMRNEKNNCCLIDRSVDAAVETKVDQCVDTNFSKENMQLKTENKIQCTHLLPSLSIKANENINTSQQLFPSLNHKTNENINRSQQLFPSLSNKTNENINGSQPNKIQNYTLLLPHKTNILSTASSNFETPSEILIKNHQLEDIILAQDKKMFDIEEKLSSIDGISKIFNNIQMPNLSAVNNQVISNISVKTDYVTKFDSEGLLYSVNLNNLDDRNNITNPNAVNNFVSGLESEQLLCCIEMEPPDLKYVTDNIKSFKNSISDGGRLASILKDKETENAKEEVREKQSKASGSYSVKYEQARNKEKLKQSYNVDTKKKTRRNLFKAFRMSTRDKTSKNNLESSNCSTKTKNKKGKQENLT